MSGGIRALKSLDVLSNNLANVNTTGFKADRPTFALHTPAQANVDPDSAEGRLAAAWAVMDGEATDFTQGSLRTTGGDTDLALEGEGFFRVAGDNDKTLLTRDGSFLVDAEGFLATRGGERVLDNAGQTLKIGAGEMLVNPKGEVRVDGAVVGTLGFADVEDRTALAKIGGNRWEVAEGTELLEATPAVRQYVLEGSNVEPVRALTGLIAINRYFEAFSKTLETSSQIDRQLNTIGRIDR